MADYLIEGTLLYSFDERTRVLGIAADEKALEQLTQGWSPGKSVSLRGSGKERIHYQDVLGIRPITPAVVRYDERMGALTFPLTREEQESAAELDRRISAHAQRHPEFLERVRETYRRWESGEDMPEDDDTLDVID